MLKQISIFLLLIALGFSNAHAQYAFDIKTTMEEKEDLQNIKQGLIQTISSSSWASEKETGEDYSVWLHNVNRVHQGDSVKVSIVVELRTPAMFSRGDFVANRKIWLKYHWQKAQEYSKDNFDRNTFKEPKSKDFAKTTENLSSMIGLISGTGGALAASELSGLDVGQLVTGLKAVFNREPSPVEVMESIYFGKQSLEAMEEMIQANR